MKLIITLFSLLIVTVSSAETEYHLNEIKQEGEALITSQLQEFREDAENENPLRQYFQGIKEFLEKSIENNGKIIKETDAAADYFGSLRSAEDGVLEFEKTKQIGLELHDKITVSKTVIEIVINWIEERIDSLEDVSEADIPEAGKASLESIELIEIIEPIDKYMSKKDKLMDIYYNLKQTENVFNQLVPHTNKFILSKKLLSRSNYKKESRKALERLVRIIQLIIFEIDPLIQSAIQGMDEIDSQ